MLLLNALLGYYYGSLSPDPNLGITSSSSSSLEKRKFVLTGVFCGLSSLLSLLNTEIKSATFKVYLVSSYGGVDNLDSSGEV